MDSERPVTPAPPPPRGTADVRSCPVAPFDLSMPMTTKAPSAAASDGKFVLPNVVLRKVAPQPIFAKFDDSAYLIKPPTQMMRFIDALRYHKPTDSEREELNISSSSERLNLHVLNDILVVCGARKGFRFNSQDITAFQSLSEQLARQFGVLDAMFQSLPLDVTRFKFDAMVKRIEDDTQFAQLMSSRCVSETPAVLSGDAATHWRALVFQWHARTYIDVFAQLRATIVSTRERLQLYFSSRKTLLDTTDLGDAVEAEFRAKVNHPFPSFLFVLIQKYHREYREEHTPWTPESTEPPVDSIAQFALFLSDQLVHHAPLTACEMHSVEVMLQILKVTYRVDYEMLKLELVGVWRGGSTGQQQIPPATTSGALTRATLCSLLYDFLATVRELRLVPRQKKLLLPHTKPRRSWRHHMSVTSTPLYHTAQHHPLR